MINRRQDNSKDVDAGITNALRELPRIEAPAGFQTAVADRIRRKESRQGFPWLVPAAVTMCALIVFVLVGLYVLNNESSTPQISSASNGSGIEKEVASDSATATDPNATDIPNDLGNSVLEVPPATMSANRSTADKARQTRRETAATPTRPGQELGGSIERAANPARDPIMPIFPEKDVEILCAPVWRPASLISSSTSLAAPHIFGTTKLKRTYLSMLLCLSENSQKSFESNRGSTSIT
ncbi:hypothetical protein [Leptolyngbya sp. 7M]|uniref:hypothetical protein n=1 Tax=Leptolyngbya sp. 7M TaxID=2812896 RepID=UPI001B8C8AFF|nr:hypothetical protein [Leptolyngbya sp. 7M]QYO62956.1 hypothetical protein JVX88_23525 [Leptolyngbya sp. 7M]